MTAWKWIAPRAVFAHLDVADADELAEGLLSDPGTAGQVTGGGR
jgi:hypothetical protein